MSATKNNDFNITDDDIKLSDWDETEGLEDFELAAAYLNNAIELGDIALLISCIGDVLKAQKRKLEGYKN